jgi:hypothetical protein
MERIPFVISLLSKSHFNKISEYKTCIWDYSLVCFISIIDEYLKHFVFIIGFATAINIRGKWCEYFCEYFEEGIIKIVESTFSFSQFYVQIRNYVSKAMGTYY